VQVNCYAAGAEKKIEKKFGIREIGKLQCSDTKRVKLLRLSKKKS
jgi:hypothetical protein